MKKSLLMFGVLLFLTLLNTYADSNYTSSLNTKTPIKLARTTNISTNIGKNQYLSAYPYDLVTTGFSWGGQAGAGGITQGNAVTTDNSENIYITGNTSVGLFGQIQNGKYDYLIVKYDKNGNLIWSRQVGASGGNTEGWGISYDSSGNVYITGWTDVGISGQKQNGSVDYFIAKYDKNGNLIWSRQGGAYDGKTYGYGITADSFGNTYITGLTNVGINNQIQNGVNDYFVAKYDTNGNLIWSKQVGVSNGDTNGYGISADNSGNVYVTGWTDIGISGQKQNGDYDYFIAKYNTNGNLIWTRQVGASNGDTEGYGISTNNSGNIYVTGYTDIGISSQKQNGDWDYFIATYDTSGNLIWSRQVGSYLGSTEGYQISASSSGNIYVTGTTNVGISNQKQNGNWDYFIATYDKTGNLIWSRQVGSYGGYTYGLGISANSLDNIYVTGNTTVGISGQKQNGYQDYFIAGYDTSGNLIWSKQAGSYN